MRVSDLSGLDDLGLASYVHVYVRDQGGIPLEDVKLTISDIKLNSPLGVMWTNRDGMATAEVKTSGPVRICPSTIEEKFEPRSVVVNPGSKTQPIIFTHIDV